MLAWSARRHLQLLSDPPKSYTKKRAHIEEIIDFVDKGACAGLQVMAATYINSDEYVS